MRCHRYKTTNMAAAAVPFAVVIALSACSRDEPPTSPAAVAKPASTSATPEVGADPVRVARNNGAMARARLRPTDGHMTSGIVEFTEMPNGKLGISVELAQLAEGEHGLHVHEVGDCSSPDAESAGEHFSPDGRTHGSPADTIHHSGDLGNVTADSRGIAIARLETSDLKLSGKYGVVERAIIVHSGEDDFITQPSGDSGDRVACGVVRMIEARDLAG